MPPATAPVSGAAQTRREAVCSPFEKQDVLRCNSTKSGKRQGSLGKQLYLLQKSLLESGLQRVIGPRYEQTTPRFAIPEALLTIPPDRGLANAGQRKSRNHHL
jgi:hypothetical protein